MLDSILLAIFVTTLAGVALLPRRAAFVAWLTASHIDLGAAGIVTSPLLVQLNTVRVLVFPIIYGVRFGFSSGLQICMKSPVFRCWLLFLLYAVLSVAWTPEQFLLSAAKQLGYFSVYTIAVVAMTNAWINNAINGTVIVFGVLIPTGLAVIQTYILGNPFGTHLYDVRYVSFASMQQFAEYMCCLFILLLFYPRLPIPIRVASAVAVLTQVAMNGSRTAFASCAIALVVLLLLQLYRRNVVPLVISFAFLAPILLAIVVLTGTSKYEAQFKSLRIYELVTASSDRRYDKVGTLGARLEIWDIAIKKMSSISDSAFVFGRGLSSVGELFPSPMTGTVQTSDSNRAIHNEYLRVFYELGFIGSFLFLLWLLTLFISLFRMPSHCRPMHLCIVTCLALFFAVENIFSGAGAAGGVGFVLALTYVLAQSQTRQQPSEVSDSVPSAQPYPNLVRS